MTTRPLVVAHRGNSSLAPQNTMAAFHSAILAGADMIELDIQVTADGGAAVIHDDTFDATTDTTGKVAERVSTDLAEIDAGAWFSPFFAGQPVPLLGDVLALLDDHGGVGLLLELKGDWDAEPLQRVVGQVSGYLADRVILQSFSVDTMALLKDLAPAMRRELLIGLPPNDILELAASLDVKGCNPSGMLLTAMPDMVKELRDAGLSCSVWTLNEADDWVQAVDMGIDRIITDRPDRLVGWLHGREL